MWQAEVARRKWIVGAAAEVVGVVAARREVTIRSDWDSGTALHPLAVHFCSAQCKDRYMARAPQASAEKVARGPTEIAVKRRGPEAQRVVTRLSGHSLKRKRRSA